MAKITGINALIYLGAVDAAAPQRNSWSLDISRELQEARVFQATGAANSWVEQIGGFRSWSGSANGFYDDANEKVVDVSHGSTAKQAIWLYEDRSTLTSYWYGEAWVDMSQDTNVDNVIELNATFTGDGTLYRFTA